MSPTCRNNEEHTPDKLPLASGWLKALGRSSLSCIWPIRSGYDVLRIFCAIVLLIAAGLKTYELSTGPTWGHGFFETRWLLFIAVEFEYFFAIWMLSGCYPKQTWLVALTCFSLFFCISLFKALSGYTSCGCFGSVQVNPWYTSALDLMIFLSLLCFRPRSKESIFSINIKQLVMHIAGVTAIWFFIALPSGYVMASYTETTLSEAGEIIGDGNIVVLKPEKWIGKRFPLLDYIDIGDQLEKGEWSCLLFNFNCPKCKKAIDNLPYNSWQAGAVQVALIEIPPFDDSLRIPVIPGTTSISHAHLESNRVWITELPLNILLSDGKLLTIVENPDLFDSQ